MAVNIGGKSYPDGTRIVYTNPGGMDRWDEGWTDAANYWIIPAAPAPAATSFTSVPETPAPTSSVSTPAASTSGSGVEIDLGYSSINICQPKFIWFECTGLRPSTPHWIFFNGVEVTKFVRTGIDRDTFDAYPKNDPIRNPGDRYLSATSYPSELGGPTAASGPITSSTGGAIYGLFYLQSNETVNFPTGTNLIYALDISAFRPENSLSLAKGSYTALAQYEYFYEQSKPVVAVSNPTYEASISSPQSYGRADYDGGEAVAFGNFQGPNLDGKAGYTAQISGPGSGTCFVAGTLITMDDGAKKKIEDIVVGDFVKGYGGINKVLALDPTILGDRKLYSFNNSGHFWFTSEHPFMTIEGWKSLKPEKTKERDGENLYNQLVGALDVGDTLVTEQGEVVIESIESKSFDNSDMPLYNFHTSGSNSYIADGYVVHNKGGGDGCFTADTLVDMADGTTKKIVDVVIGDKVWNKDKTAINEVKLVEVVDGSQFGYLYSPGDEKPFATVNHPMFINGEIVAGDAEVASYYYPWLTKQYGSIKQLTNVKYKTASPDLVYNLWLDGDGTYIVNGYGTTSIIGDGGLVSLAHAKGYMTHDQVMYTMKCVHGQDQELSYGAYLVNKALGKLDINIVTKGVCSIIHTLENPKSLLTTTVKAVGFIALVLDGKKSLFKKTRSVATKSST